jgi:hypothetical protein
MKTKKKVEKKLSIRVTENEFKLVNELRTKYSVNISEEVRNHLLFILSKKQLKHGK